SDRTSNSRVSSGTPSMETSNRYLPVGNPRGIEMWNSVALSPVGAMGCSVSLRTCPSGEIHLALRTVYADEPVVRTDAKIMPLGLKIVAFLLTCLLLSTDRPRSTAVMMTRGAETGGAVSSGGLALDSDGSERPARYPRT